MGFPTGALRMDSLRVGVAARTGADMSTRLGLVAVGGRDIFRPLVGRMSKAGIVGNEAFPHVGNKYVWNANGSIGLLAVFND